MYFLSILVSFTLASLLAVTPTLSWAEVPAGGDIGGGGDVLILPDDRVVLADPFIKRAGSRFELHPALIEELERAGKLLMRFTVDTRSNKEARHFIRDEVLSPLIDYRFVTELASACARIAVDRLPEGSRNELAACTHGNITEILEHLFRKMSVREQAKLIIHERMRAVQPSPPAEYIADVTNGIEVALSLYNEQRQGQLRELTDVEVNTLEVMMLRMGQLKLGKLLPTVMRVWKNGGGVAYRHMELDASNYLGVGTQIGREVKVGRNNILLFVSCHASSLKGLDCRIGSGNTIEAYDLDPNIFIKIGDDNVLTSSAIAGSLELANGSSIRNSTIKGHLQLGNGASIARSKLDVRVTARIGENGSISDSALKMDSIAMATDAKVEKTLLTSQQAFDEPGPELAIDEKGQLNNVVLHTNADVFIRKRARLVNTQFQFHAKTSVAYDVAAATVFIPMAMTVIPAMSAVTFFREEMKYLEDGGSRVLYLPKGVTVDGDGKPACPEGEEVFSSGRARVKNFAGLTKRCRPVTAMQD